MNSQRKPHSAETCSTREAAALLGLAVRSVQLMADRGELEAWRTPGGHRRIRRASIDHWLAQQRSPRLADDAPPPPRAAIAPVRRGRTAQARTLLLIEDSLHYQRLIAALIHQHFPDIELLIAGTGITGLALFGEHKPDLLLVDILLPDLDGPSLVTTLRTDPLFNQSELVIVTALDEDQRAPYRYVLQGLPLIHKTDLVRDLIDVLRARLPAALPSAAP